MDPPHLRLSKRLESYYRRNVTPYGSNPTTFSWEILGEAPYSVVVLLSIVGSA